MQLNKLIFILFYNPAKSNLLNEMKNYFLIMYLIIKLLTFKNYTV